MISLRPAGEEKAHEALADFLDLGRPEGWTADTAKARGVKAGARNADTADDKAKPSRRKGGSRAGSATVGEWVDAWKRLNLPVDGHAVLKSNKGADLGVFGLWAIREAVGDAGKVVSTSNLARFLLDAFVIPADSRNLGRALERNNKDKVVNMGGTRYQLTPTGIARAREMAGLPPDLRAVPTDPTASSAGA
jgi:hypothetical protein